MDTIGARLKELREQARKSQEAFGVMAGVGKRTQINYEQDLRVPDAAYMAALAAAGFDVLYILIGQRDPDIATLSREEQELLALYRASSPAGKAAMRATGAAVAHASQGSVAIAGAHNTVTVNAAPKRRSRK